MLRTHTKFPALAKTSLPSAFRLLSAVICLLAAVVLTPQANAAVTKVAAGQCHSLYLIDDGTLWAMGWNAHGQLGDGTTATRSTPVQVATGVIAVVSGESHSLFVKGDGTLWAMGYNGLGQLGDGTTTDRSTPVQVATGVIAVAAGCSHSLFLKSDGTLWGMGYTGYGQLSGDITMIRCTPAQIATGVITVAAGYNHSLFVKSDGTLWGMGDNWCSDLGDGTTTQRNTPMQIATGVITVAAGQDYSLFVKSDGTLWGMGSNFFGTLGDSTTTDRSTPVQITTGVIAVAAQYRDSLFMKSDGTLWGMGWNINGELGDSTTTGRSTPVQMTTDIIAMAIGMYHSLFVKNDGTLWAAGWNSDGQLGDGTTTTRKTPVCVAGGSAPVIITQLADQTANVGQNTTFVIEANGLPSPTLQWQSSPTGSGTWTNLSNTGPYTGVTTGTLIIAETSAATIISGSTAELDGGIFIFNNNGNLAEFDGMLIYVTATTPALNGTQYRCVATNYAGSATSNAATLTVNYVPKIATQPASQAVVVGDSVTFTITAVGNSTPVYQWQSAPFGGSAWADISGETSATLIITDATAAMSGTQYRCVVTNSAGSAISNAAALYVFSDSATVEAQQLKIQLEATGTATVAVTGAVDLALVGGATVTSGKTISGEDATATITGGLTITTSASNTVILGVNFNGGALDIDGADDVTVTNCTFTDTPVSITGGADNTAFAWNKFTATAAGKGSAMRIDNAGATIGILLQDNLWADGLVSDMPAVTNARVLMFNNYFTATGNDTATIAGFGAQILSQNNIYQGTNNPLITQDGGLLCALGNFMTETTGTTAAGNDTVFVPAYSYTMLPAGIDTPDAAVLTDLITTYAGNTAGQLSVNPPTFRATLQITRDTTIYYPPGTYVTTVTVFNPYPSPPPTSTTVFYGRRLSLTIGIFSFFSNPDAVTQWYRDNFAIPGATGYSYTIANATSADAGAYSVAMTSTSGEIVTSGAFTVSIDASSSTTGGGNSGGNQTNNSGGGAPSLWYSGAIACFAALRLLRHNRHRA